MFENGMSVGELIEELKKLDPSKMIWQRLDFYHGGIKSIQVRENGDYCFDEFKKNFDTEKLVQEFIEKFKEKYPDLIIEYKFEGGVFDITHNYEDEETDTEFETCVDKLLDEYIYQNNVYDVSFRYDHFKYHKSLKK